MDLDIRPRPALHHLRPGLAVLAVCLLLGALTAAGPAVRPALGAGRTVDHGNTPAQAGLVTAKLQELWQVGGQDDDFIFGSVASAQADPQGNVLLLDGQLAVVQVLSPDGDLVRTVCGEGEGPGEVRRPGDMLVAPDGTICVLQSFPGRIVKLHPDGTPAGEAKFTTGQQGEGQFSVLVRGLSAGPDLLLAGIRMDFSGAGLSTQTYFLARCDGTGLQRQALLEKQYTINYADFQLDETGMDFIWTRVAAAPDGTVYTAADRNRYAIEVYPAAGPGGKDPALVITREVSPLPRTEKQRQLARQILEGIGANYPTPPKSITIEDTPAVIEGMWATADGRLWVQTSAGNRTPPSGCWTVLDVFGADGAFLRQVALPGTHSADKDGLFILRDGRLVVVVGALDAFLNQQGVAGEEDAGGESDPLAVICYEMKP